MTETVRADIAVVGAGPAGIAAAVAASRAGKRVALLDDSPRPGGNIWRNREVSALPRSARARFAELGRPEISIFSGAGVFDVQSGFAILAETSSGRLEVRAPRIVLATGAREIFLPFPGWTLPGVVGVGGAQALLKTGADFSRSRAVVAGSGPLLLAVASALAKAGARLASVDEQAPSSRLRRFALGLAASNPSRIWRAALYRSEFAGTPYRAGTWVTRAEGADALERVFLTDGRREWREKCEILCTGYGLTPSTGLARLIGCRHADSFVEVDDLQQTSVPGVYCAGEPTGIGGVELALVEGEIAGLSAAGADQSSLRSDGLRRKRATQRRFSVRLATAFALRPELREIARPDTLVCRCEDVALARFDPSWTRRQAKLYTRAGMGPCQGRVCGPALQFLFGWREDTLRPPERPVSLSSLVPGPDEISPDSQERIAVE
jgi:NADPH-dependent 2,4-dienoyl-CoA reductase/sulfur reductase-like enzyme